MKPQARQFVVLVLLVLAALAAQSWWAGHVRDQLGPELARLARPGDIHMISSDSCGVCAQARSWFIAQGVAYSECSIERDAACRQQYQALGGAGTPTFLVRGQPQLGFSAPRLQAALQR